MSRRKYKNRTEWRAAHPDKWQQELKKGRERRRERLLGVKPEEFEKIFIEQGKKCAICGGENPGENKDWCLDHDHATGKHRGILCDWCNRGLGYFKDDVYRLISSIKYLKRYNANTAELFSTVYGRDDTESRRILPTWGRANVLSGIRCRARSPFQN